MLEPLKRPFKKRYDKIRSYAGRFVSPVKESVSKLLALVPSSKAFAGSEDLAEDTGKKAPAKLGFMGRLKSFKQSLKGLSDFQKLLLLSIAVVLPAGIIIAVALAKFLRRKK